MDDYKILIIAGIVVLALYLLWVTYIFICLACAVISHRLEMFKEKREAKKQEKDEKN